MKSEKTLEQKITEAEVFMPGSNKLLESYSYKIGGEHFSGGVEDLEAAETGDYKVIAARWNQHCYSESGGGVEWQDWLEILYAGNGGEIKRIKTTKIVTRHECHPSQDKEELWPFKYASIESVSDGAVLVAWANKEGQTTRQKLIDFAEYEQDFEQLQQLVSKLESCLEQAGGEFRFRDFTNRDRYSPSYYSAGEEISMIAGAVERSDFSMTVSRALILAKAYYLDNPFKPGAEEEEAERFIGMNFIRRDAKEENIVKGKTAYEMGLLAKKIADNIRYKLGEGED